MKAKHLAVTIVMLVGAAGVSGADIEWRQVAERDGLPAHEVRTIVEGNDGALWFGTDGGGLVKYDGETSTAFTEKDGLVYNKVRSVAIDQKGTFWCGTPRGLATFDGVSWATVKHEELGSANITAVAVDTKNITWVGAYRKGLFRFDGDVWKQYTAKDGLTGDVVQTIFQDEDGSLWIGTDGGITIMNDGMIERTITHKDFPGNVVFTIARDNKGLLWAGTDNGPCSFDGVEWRSYDVRTKFDILNERCVYSIEVEDDNTLWFGTTTGVWKYDGTYWENWTSATTDGTVNIYNWTIHRDSKGNRWIGGKKGLALSESMQVAKPAAKKAAVPEQLTLTGNYPNPFNPTTTIGFTLPESGAVTLDVYSVTGQKVRTLVSESLTAGNHEIMWDGTDESGLRVSSGVYISRLQFGGVTLSHKMQFIK